MSSWSCPECGRECLPTERDCPDCQMIAAHPQLLAPEPVAVEAVVGPPQGLRLARRPRIAPRDRCGTALLSKAVPRDPPLAGPALPADLRQFAKHGASEAAARPSGRRRMPGPVMAALMFAALLCVLGIALNFKASAQAPWSHSPPATAARGDYPFAKFIEATGLRVVMNANRRSQAQYLVVNHSGADLTDLDLRLAVHAAGSSAVLFTLSTRLPALGAYEAKEIRSDLDLQIGAAEIPDWDRLRVDAQVTAQQ